MTLSTEERQRAADQREAVVAEAKTFLRTPYHHQACIKGVGVDCAMLPAAVYHAAGVIPAVAPVYARQWHLHRNEEIYLGWIEALGAREIERSAIGPGDFAVWRFGRTFSHGAIIIEPPVIIHAHIDEGVTLADMDRDSDLPGRAVKFFTLWDA